MNETSRPKVRAEMCVWRIYGIRDDYLSKRRTDVGDWRAVFDDRPQKGDVTTLQVGALTERFIKATSEAKASFPVMLGMGDWGKAPDRLTARDHSVREQLKSVSLEDITRGFHTWLSIEVARPVEVGDATGTEFIWVDAIEAEELAESYPREVAAWLDYVAAVALSTLSGVTLDRAVVVSERPTFIAPGKGAMRWPKFSAGSASVSVGKRWDELPLDKFEVAAANVRHASPRQIEEFGSAAKWLTASLRERDDALRKFLFAFFGLEVLAGKYAKKHQRSVVEGLKRRLGGLPIEELVWPKEADDDFPDRNLVFRFAVMSVTLTPNTAAEDVAAFKLLKKARDGIAHGGDFDSSELPADACTSLLRRYLGLAVLSTT